MPAELAWMGCDWAGGVNFRGAAGSAASRSPVAHQADVQTTAACAHRSQPRRSVRILRDRVLGAVIRRFLRDRDIMGMAFPYASR